ncbi:MAG: glycosyl hydrolase [Bacteroides sp.]|nr:glycosyl hydrolase [Bacteroides sp.]
MNKLKYLFALPLLALGFVACDDDDEYTVTEVDTPVLQSSSPSDGATGISTTLSTITLTFDKNIFFASSNADQITLNGESVSSALVYGSSSTLTITPPSLERATTYTLSIPAGLITGPGSKPVDAISISFTTLSQSITSSLSNASADAATQALYAEMVSNYGSKIYSATMANVNWNYDNATQVYEWTGKYPAINCFDYLHLYASPANWIDYSDITPVQEWHNAGGIVAAMWHWNVPISEGSEDLSFSADGNSFSVTNALTAGTWENTVLTEDLASIVEHLKLLQDAGIPVLWRPLHEAAGAWFWWGAEDATAYVSLWQYMYTYFKEQGLNNLIWVWTSEGGDDTDWYPGDNYVDIVSIDIYNNTDTSDILSLYNTLYSQYPDKMITLSECGSVATISAQWSATSYWSWFMPWYNTDDTTHADEAWWTDAMNQSYVITR